MAEEDKLINTQVTQFNDEFFQSNFIWKLEAFNLMPNSCYVSEKFDIPATKFYSFLQINKMTESVQMKFVLSYHGKNIADEDYKHSFYWFFVKTNTEEGKKEIWCTDSKALSPFVLIDSEEFVKEKVDTYLNNKCLELHIEVYIETTRLLKNFVFCSLDLSDMLSKDYEAALKNDEQKDVTFIIAGKTIKAHKAILGARSPVFKAMFREGTKEAETNVAEIRDIKFDTFEELIYFIYTGRITKNFSLLAMELFELAHKYQIESLKMISEQEIHKNLSEDNASAVLQLTKMFKCSNELKEETFKLYKKNIINKVAALKSDEDLKSCLEINENM